MEISSQRLEELKRKERILDSLWKNGVMSWEKYEMALLMIGES